jgi:hypothetical protein
MGITENYRYNWQNHVSNTCLAEVVFSARAQLVNFQVPRFYGSSVT